MQALCDEGFHPPESIDSDKIKETHKDSCCLTHRPHYYDQIAVRIKYPRLEVTGGGMFNLFEHVFRAEDMDAYQRPRPREAKRHRDEGSRR
jgi:hypothetical protein